MGVLGLLAASLSVVVIQDQAELRRGGCTTGDQVLARLAGGTPVTPRFAFDGACYKVTVALDGGLVEGYLPAGVLQGLKQFETARRAARETISSPAPRPAPAPGASAGQLAQAGLAAYRADDVRGAAELWRQSLEKQPDGQVETLLRRAERELKGDVSGSRKAGTRFILRYDETKLDSESARGLLAVLEQEYSRISYELGCRAEERLIAIVQSLEDYRRSTDAAAWSGGQYDGRIRVAMIEPSPGPATHRAFAHEIVHACLAGLGQYPLWLHEGLAQKLSGDGVAPAVAGALKTALRGGSVPRLDRIGQDWSRLSPRHSALAYAVALRAVELFYQHHAALGIRNLLRNPELIGTVTADLDRRLRE